MITQLQLIIIILLLLLYCNLRDYCVFKGLFLNFPNLKVYSGFKDLYWNLRDCCGFKGLFWNLQHLKVYSRFKGLFWNLNKYSDICLEGMRKTKTSQPGCA